jgi:Fe-S cluster biogenesis protein NfuA
MNDQEQFHQRVKAIEGLVREVEAIADPRVRTTVEKLVQSLMELNGEGLNRLLEIVSESGQAGQDLIDRAGRDELVGSLLVLYGLHPLDLEARIGQALDRVQPQLHKHGTEISLLDTTGGVIRVRLDGSGHGCGASGLKAAVEDAIYRAAPDLVALHVEGAGDGHQAVGFVALSALRSDTGAHSAGPRPLLEHTPLGRTDALATSARQP